MVKYQEEYDSYIFVADMHSITIPQDPKTLANNIMRLVQEQFDNKMYVSVQFES